MKAFYVDRWERSPCIIKFYSGRRDTFTIIKFLENGDLVERECKLKNLFVSKERWAIPDVFFTKSS